MNDITIQELTESVTDDFLKAWLTQAGEFPKNFTTCEFLVKLLQAATSAARAKNETLEAGTRILAYPAPVNGPIEISKNGVAFFRSTFSLTSAVAVSLDAAQAPNG